MSRCAIYARYSSDLQSPCSIEDQIRLCRAHAERQGWTVVATFETQRCPASGSSTGPATSSSWRERSPRPRISM
jgi:site-specific DNA recombinase